MWFGVLGPLEVRDDDGRAVAVGGARARGLLVLLALDAGRVVPVERLIDAQYGEEPPAGAANAVQAQVSRLRRVLPEGLVAYEGAGYRLAAAPDDVDAHRFARLAAEGRRLLADGGFDDAVATLTGALALWRGPALADLPAHAATAPATRLDELRLSATEDLTEARLSLGDPGQVPELRRLVAAHPLRERPAGQLMRALHAAGRRAEALTVYAETRRVLADRLGTDPSPELSAVHQDILRATDAPAPAPAALPAQLTTFVGRDAELARLTAGGSRLITVTGPGGIGKTRLALEAAARLTGEVGLVDLSAAGPEQVVQVALAAVGVRDGGYRERPVDPAERLAGALRGRDLLLVVDNCEHVIDAAARLVRDVLAAGVRVLATSREPLGITGETLVPLAPLDAAGGDAVRLFADRAAAVRPGFTLDDATLPAVARICAALDGLPLAIELAAARLRGFGLDDLAERLAAQERFALLDRGDRTAAARHRTLRSVVEWSWDLLSPAEKTLARRFAVFTGGATLAAAEAVCGPAGTLADLVDKSLLETDGHRYRMLDTIRLFCAEKLAASGEEAEVRAGHAAYFLDFARRADPHLRRAEQLDWLAALAADHGNLMAALRWSAEHEPETGMRLVAALAAYWWLSGRRAEAGAPAALLLDRAGASGLEEEYLMCVVHAVPRAAPEHWARGREIVRTMTARRRYPFALALWGMAAGPPAASAREADRVLPPDPWNRALVRLSDALMTWFDGVPVTAEAELESVLAEFRGLGERWGTAQCLDWLALLAGWRGAWERADALWGEALALLAELGASDESVDVLVHRAEAWLRAGGDAAGDLRRAEELARTAGLGDMPSVLFGLGEVARASGDLGTARGRYVAALGSVDAVDDWLGMRSRVLLALARLEEAANRPDEARERYAEALAEALRHPTTETLITAAEAKAALLTDPAQSARLLGAATALRGTKIAGDRDVERVAASARTRLGEDAYAAAYRTGMASSRAEIQSELG